MKKFAIGAVVAAALLTFQPATASTTEPPIIAETSITAPVAVLTVDSPVVTTEPAPVAVAEPVAVIPEPVAPEPVVEPVTPTVEPVVVPVAPAEPVEVVTPTPVPSEPVATDTVPAAETEPTIFTQVCSEARPCFGCIGDNCELEEAYNLAMETLDWDRAKAMNQYAAIQPAAAEHRLDWCVYIPSVENPEDVYVFALTTDDLTK